MGRIIADLHVHSHYSRATSREMNVPLMAAWARKKGIHILGTGDFTHPAYIHELKSILKPSGNGLFAVQEEPTVHFMLTAEISSIYSQGGRTRRVHNLIMAPDFRTVEKINRSLGRLGNLRSDGRPILGLSSRDLIKIVLDASPDCLVVPAHVWTPWFSLFGSKSGFDSIEECFGEYTAYIYAIETGLSSDPAMNWRLSALDRVTLLSNSDAHSPLRLGREATVFDCTMDYFDMIDTIKRKDRKRLLSTIEFFPDEGKYYYDGHRSCNVLYSPAEAKRHNNLCPSCKRPLTIGVIHRIDQLADREEGYIPEGAVAVRHMVPLIEILGAAYGRGINSLKVKREYERLLGMYTEFDILLNVPMDELYRCTDRGVVDGIINVREGKVAIVPGYDGVYGKVSIFSAED